MLSKKQIQENNIKENEKENARENKCEQHAIKSLKNGDDEQAFRDILSAWKLDPTEIDDVRNYALNVHE